MASSLPSSPAAATVAAAASDSPAAVDTASPPTSPASPSFDVISLDSACSSAATPEPALTAGGSSSGRGDSRDDVEAKEQPPQQPGSGGAAFSCPSCLKLLRGDDASDNVRVLPCLCKFCVGCLQRLFDGPERGRSARRCPQRALVSLTRIVCAAHPVDILARFLRSTIRCPQCSSEHPASADSKVTRFPSAAQIEQLMIAAAESKKKKKVFPCSELECDAEATHDCEVCGLQCAEHESALHRVSPFASHTRLTLAEKASWKTAAIESAAKVRVQEHSSRCGSGISALTETRLKQAEEKLANDRAGTNKRQVRGHTGECRD